MTLTKCFQNLHGDNFYYKKNLLSSLDIAENVKRQLFWDTRYLSHAYFIMVPKMTNFHVLGKETVIVVFFEPFTVAPKDVVVAIPVK